MSLSLATLCVAATALIAFITSALVGGGLVAARRVVARLSPGSRARLLLVGAVAPVLVSAAALLAALSPSFGWIADHCLPAGHPHGHPHLCAAHHQIMIPTLPLLALAALLVARVLAAWTAATYGAIASRRVRRALETAAIVESGLRVIPVAEGQAFLVGILRPVLFVTRGLLVAPLARHLDAVLAHERAHLRRRDALRRFAALLALPFHAPGVARWIDRELGHAHEMAADDEAAESLASRRRIAEAIVAVSRSALAAPRAAIAFAGTAVEQRVARLMADREELRGPGARLLTAVVLATVLAIVASADAVHHGVEMTLGLLGG